MSPSVDRVAERMHFVCALFILNTECSLHSYSHLGNSWTLRPGSTTGDVLTTLSQSPSPFPCNMRLGDFRKYVLRRRSNGWLYGQTVNHTLPTPTSSACITERLKRGWPRTQVKNAFCVCFFCPEHLSANYSACECLKF